MCICPLAFPLPRFRKPRKARVFRTASRHVGSTAAVLLVVVLVLVLLPPAATCCCLLPACCLPAAAACCCLPLPAAACCRLLLPAAASAVCCRMLPTQVSDSTVAAHSCSAVLYNSAGAEVDRVRFTFSTTAVVKPGDTTTPFVFVNPCVHACVIVIFGPHTSARKRACTA